MDPLTEQRRIAEVLDQAEALRAKRRAALVQLDTLGSGDLLRHTRLFHPILVPQRRMKARAGKAPDLRDCGCDDQVGCEARKIPAEGDVFFLDFSFYRTNRASIVNPAQTIILKCD
jgi:hypothetical protein